MTNRGPQAHIVDVSGKDIVERVAQAEGRLRLKASTLSAIRDGRIEKGNVQEIGRTAALFAIKNTAQLLPLCHPLPLEAATVDFELQKDALRVQCEVRAHAKTGVEMEALVGATVALLTVWDLVKPLEKDARGQYPTTALESVRVVRKVKRA